MPEIFVVHRHDPHNIGDIWSAPSCYPEQFPWLRTATTIDIEFDIPGHADRLREAYVIYGGGGLLGTGFFDRQLDQLLGLAPKKLVVWGAGHNNNERRDISEPAYLADFDLVGIRDHGRPGYDWVPCPSALIRQLADPPPPVHDVVVYQHRDAKLGPPAAFGHPVLKNDHEDLAETIAFLASGATVVTNSYHGVYWATLLGRRVVLVNPFSSKFAALRYPVPVVPGDDWRPALGRARAYPGALAECRAKTLAFGETVRGFFSG